MINTVREVLERNISTIEKISFYLDLEVDLIDANFEVSGELVEEIENIIGILSKRDEIIQKSMQIMEEKFEKVWGIPWELVRIIHRYTWNRNDLKDITSKA